ncbi:MAG: adenosine kinase, partial [Alphaproteobacteria bacterium]
KGGMQLIDPEQAQSLYAAMGPGVEHSGGSAANTAAGIASLGGRAAFLGKVADDALGQAFRRDMEAVGVHDASRLLSGGKATARCLILVTPDAQRTMNTFLGACTELRPEDIDDTLVAEAAVTYLEGYLWDAPDAKAAIRKAATVAAGAGRRVSLSLSDSFCVDRHRDEFQELVRNHVDILFANETEILSLYQSPTFDDAARAVRDNCAIAVLTRGAMGSVVVAGDDTIGVAAESGVRVVDTTGAGDQFAAGFLYGLTHGLSLDACARLGGIAAAEIISHFGARPETPLAELARGFLSTLKASA